MYAAISLQRLVQFLVWSFMLWFVGRLILFGVPPTNGQTWLRFMSSTVSYWSIILFLLFGLSHKWAPWRVIWRVFPVLNDLVFPDLNGVWRGTTRSNWPAINAMRSAAKGAGGLDLDALPAMAPREDSIEITITASLFNFRIEAKLAGTEGRSHSLGERVTRDERRANFELSYIYRQSTPAPAATDESSHEGAATLDFDRKAATLSGHYWTRRSWTFGYNTAGRLVLTRAAI